MGTKRSPDQGVQRFENRPGEEFPKLQGMSRLDDEAQIPANKHHLLVNARLSPGELSSRPGLTEVLDTNTGECITGLIETVENQGKPGSPVAGLIGGYSYPCVGYKSTFPLENLPYGHFLTLYPDELENPTPGPTPGDPIYFDVFNEIQRPATPYTGGIELQDFVAWPWKGVMSHVEYGLPGSGGPWYGIFGPDGPFRFQGDLCILGTLAQGSSRNCALFSMNLSSPPDDATAPIETILAPDRGSLGTKAIFGDYLVTSSVTRSEIIEGEIKEVLYFGDFETGAIMRFDGVTLSQWHPGLSGRSIPRLFVSGQELVVWIDAYEQVLTPGPPYDPWNLQPPASLYQPAPGTPIVSGVVTDPSGWFFGYVFGTTGCVKWRDRWYATFDCVRPEVSQWQIGLAGTPSGGGLGWGVWETKDSPLADNEEAYMWGGLTVHQDVLYWVETRKTYQEATTYFTSDDRYWLGRSTNPANPPQHEWLQLPGTPWDDFSHGHLFSFGQELLLPYGSLDSAVDPWDSYSAILKIDFDTPAWGIRNEDYINFGEDPSLPSWPFGGQDADTLGWPCHHVWLYALQPEDI